MIEIEKIEKDPVKDNAVEIVERKGIGHPDSICDGVAESISQALCQEYINRFGKILHHNTDEVQLVAGDSSPEIGGGEINEKIYLLLTGRATKEFKGEKIPVDEIAVETAKKYIEENFKELSPKNFKIESKIGETSTDLEQVYEELSSNDTSFGVGHAPLSEMEKTVLNIANKLPEEVEEVGEDVKVMGARRKNEKQITVAAAVISNRINSLEEYKQVISRIGEFAEEESEFEEVEVNVNTADNYEEDSIYITETGTSAEMGDDGSVGRGNRVNGLITPNRSMSMEAASGKNPVTHVGKIYNLKAKSISEKISDATDSFTQVKLLAQIGSSIKKPQIAHIETTAENKEKIRSIVEGELENMEEIRDKAVEGSLTTF
ncbi:methionine adenosyltransferase [Candidatus Nanohalobium constans]|uniref:S-adenosylmethionine synthetase n=1 Tax=Candidatus Nanohalobium constans TaxID=2565781 RepID=A0A5Q0UFD1_9ARCH|nr:methionine adenosyltransferase [Candidatus Nanohalobium constans]QGA80276.1 S-adenosylmethionine synthetase [Candidatus Nanohalobium constans]